MNLYQPKAFQRGDVYYITFNNAIGSEISTGRPGVIVSSDEECKNNTVLMVVYLTTSTNRFESKVNVKIESARRSSLVLCNQVTPVDRARFKDYYCTVTPNELRAIDRAIAYSLGIPYGIVEDTSASDKLRTEKVELEEELAKTKLEKLDISVERDFYKKLYESALSQFAGVRLEQDLNHKQVQVTKQPTETKPKSTEDDQVDLNSCSPGDLKKLGLKEDVIVRIIDGRPFKSVDDLRLVRGMTSVGYQIIKHRVKADPVKVDAVKVEPVKANPVKVTDKVNINTADWKELCDVVGMSKSMAYAITGYRKREGKYRSLDDLVNVPRVGKNGLMRFKDKLEV